MDLTSIADILAAVPSEEVQAKDNIRMYLAVGSLGVGLLCLVGVINAAGKARNSRVLFLFVVGLALIGVGLWMFMRVKYLWGL